eukprot:gene11383-9894_t
MWTTSLLAWALALPGVQAACTSAMDCQLNGACDNGRCVCDKGWKGSDCGQLSLDS